MSEVIADADPSIRRRTRRLPHRDADQQVLATRSLAAGLHRDAADAARAEHGSRLRPSRLRAADGSAVVPTSCSTGRRPTKLYAYASSPAQEHRPAWSRFNKAARKAPGRGRHLARDVHRRARREHVRVAPSRWVCPRRPRSCRSSATTIGRRRAWPTAAPRGADRVAAAQRRGILHRLTQDRAELRGIGTARVAEVDLMVLAGHPQPVRRHELVVQAVQHRTFVVVRPDVQDLDAPALIERLEAQSVDRRRRGPAFAFARANWSSVIQSGVRIIAVQSHRDLSRSTVKARHVVGPPQSLERHDDVVAV